LPYTVVFCFFAQVCLGIGNREHGLSLAWQIGDSSRRCSDCWKTKCDVTGLCGVFRKQEKWRLEISHHCSPDFIQLCF